MRFIDDQSNAHLRRRVELIRLTPQVIATPSPVSDPRSYIHSAVLRPGAVTKWRCLDARQSPTVLTLYWTTMVPCSMFIPHANAMSPGFAGVNSITTGSLSGSARLMFRD